MPITGKLFPGQEREEKVFLLIRKHWFNYLTFGMLALLAIVPVLIAIYLSNFYPAVFEGQMGDIIIFGLSTFVLFILGLLLYGFVNYYLDVYIITDRRIVDILQDGFFKRSISELHLLQVQDVNAKVEGFFETIMHFGDVYIQTAGERENFIFKSIPHPYTIAKTIIDLHEMAMDRPKRKKDPSKVTGSDDNGLPFDELELNAKKLFSDSSFGDRVKKQGTVIKKEIAEKFAVCVNCEPKNMHGLVTKADIVKNFSSHKNIFEGEMSEGKEIKI